jgi:polysaccharide pyruvyl transferase WcaK-like protein
MGLTTCEAQPFPQQERIRTVEGYQHGNMQHLERRRKKIAFFGHFDSSNFGNESTLQAILYHLRCFHPDAEVICISTGHEATVATHQIEAIPLAETFGKWRLRNPFLRAARKICIGIPRELYSWPKYLMRLRRMDMLIIPGTGLLTDAFGLLGWGPYTMFKWSLIAKICRCKLLFVSVGAGPIYGILGKCFVRSALSLADFRSYRDKSTVQYLEGIGFRADNDRVYPDLAFSLPEAAIPNPDTTKSRRCVVGVGLMEYGGMYSVPGPISKNYLAYLENFVTFVKWLLEHGYDVRLLSGDLADMHARQKFSDLLRERLSVRDGGRIVDEPVLTVENLLSQIAATDIVVATRFHNVLLALLCNKPVISISFHHKCASLMNAMELSGYCLDINELKVDRVIERFCDLEANADKLKPLIRQKVAEFRKALDEQYSVIFNDCNLDNESWLRKFEMAPRDPVTSPPGIGSNADCVWPFH